MFGWGKRKRRSMTLHLVVALAFILAGAIGLWLLISGEWRVSTWLGAWLASANVVTFGYYGYDKYRARTGLGNRIPELILHAIAALGGSLGAYAGMRWFRHKTIKGSFRILFWLIVAVQVTLIAWVIWRHFQ